MHTGNLIKAGLLAVFITLIALVSWEFYLRHIGIPASYDDNSAIWADKRGQVYEPRDQAVVFIGSSRIKFDLDIPTWQALTGTHAVQLAVQGSNPRPILQDLANDKNFKGNLVIDVTEGLFFSESSEDPNSDGKIAYYHKITPTQRFGFQVDHVLESTFVFLDQDNFSLNTMLAKLPVPLRKGVEPDVNWPVDFDRCAFNRQSYMTPHFVEDTSEQKQVQAIWVFFGSRNKSLPVTGRKLDSIFDSVKMAVDKIKGRGGQVIFVRTPSSGPYREIEKKGFPRSAYWDRLLAITGCPGFYFEDNPATAPLTCPEWSHLAPADALTYTKTLVKVLQEEKGWSFNKKEAAL